ncbi:MAG: DUF4830 domain-containing protein [Oscillospiraceae bacterium]|nr:DUF4830 domain-containing protein [Oscillospiraceae bacterium]
MITASVKTSRTKIIGTLCIILAVIIGLILFFGGKGASDAAEAVSRRVADNEERREYLASKGVETAPEPSSIEDILLPAEMDETLMKYNEMQLGSGFDISPYLGKTVRKYVYPVEGTEETFATLYIYKENIIAADIASHIEGWQKAVDGGENIG